MPVKVPHHQVVVQRNGVNVQVPIGKPFDFTDAEVKEIRSYNLHALRSPVNESIALNDTEVLNGGKVPEDADTTRDANILAKAKPKAGGAARNQGGSREEGTVASGGKSLAAAADDDEEL